MKFLFDWKLNSVFWSTTTLCKIWALQHQKLTLNRFFGDCNLYSLGFVICIHNLTLLGCCELVWSTISLWIWNFLFFFSSCGKSLKYRDLKLVMYQSILLHHVLQREVELLKFIICRKRFAFIWAEFLIVKILYCRFVWSIAILDRGGEVGSTRNWKHFRI